MPHLAVQRIAKSYDGNPAVRDISFGVAHGRVLALCGETGAGKSTLMRMLSGATRPDSGAILIDGKPVEIARPADAMALGICTVYQELSLLPHLSVAENVLLGRMPARGLPFVIDWGAANRIAGRVLADLGFPDVDPAAPLGSLSVARQQIIEIAKALVTEPRILILDEPTAGVDVELRHTLWDFVREINLQGTTILLTTHYLEEAEQICGRIAIMNHGDLVALEPTAALLERLGGRTLLVELRQPLVALPPGLERCGARLSSNGSRLDVPMNGGPDAGEILGLLCSQGIAVADIETRRAGLEEVFLKLTGIGRRKRAGER
jgi:ABC-type sugar transport system ATPase subunit